MKEQNIEQLFKDGLNNLEADVPQGVWTNIQQGLQVPVNAPASSVAAKSAGIIGKMGLKSLLMISAASITVVSSIIYFASDKEAIKKAETELVPVKNEPVIVPSKNLQVENSSPSLIIENKSVKQEAVTTAGKPSALKVNEAPKITEEKVAIPAAQPHVQPTIQPTIQPTQKSQPQVNDQKNNQPVDNQTSDIQSKKDDLNQAGNIQPVAESAPVFDDIENYLSANSSGEKPLPNIFTPNHDGQNDYFNISTSGLKSLEVVIYDMKGKKIYSQNSLNISWDGTLSNGRDAEVGNYFYTIYAETNEGKICIAKSPLTLKRDRQN